MGDALLQQITAAENIDAAYRWLCKQRHDYSAHSDIWDLRFHWPTERAEIIAQLQSGSYHFGVITLYPIAGEVRALWCARDALVLHAIAQVLGAFLEIHPACLHVKGGGGVAAGIDWAYQQQADQRYFFRSDVKGYYRHIRHGVLLKQLRQQIACRKLIAILRRYLARTEQCGGVYCPKHQGLNKGDPLAPLMGALYLQKLDRALSKLGAYRRFMDDWLLFLPSQTRLNRARVVTARVLKSLGMTIHPDKTFFGRCSQPFHFLGLQFAARQITLTRQRLLAIKIKVAALKVGNAGVAVRYVERLMLWLRSVWPRGYERAFCCTERVLLEFIATDV